MTKPQTRNHQMQPLTPPASQTTLHIVDASENFDDEGPSLELDLEDKEQKLEIITRLIDCIKSI